MSAELTTTVTTNIEQVLLGGDLSKLNPQERLNYYNAVCTSLGLNPLTQPFSYIVLNGKLQLYAKKDCTEQLRKLHGVSITKVDPRQIGDLLVVVADATDRDGRTDSATGAVNLKGLTGENLANAMMRAETKSKRRVTLSICGLGMLDETEIDTLREQGTATEPQGNNWREPEQNRSPEPAAIPATVPTTDSGEPDIRPRSQRTAQPSTQPPPTPSAASQGQQQPQGEVMAEPVISDKQRKRMFAIQKSCNLSDQDVHDIMRHIGLTCGRDDIPRSRYNQLIDEIDPNFKFHTNNPK
jgi:hypothetical protein